LSPINSDQSSNNSSLNRPTTHLLTGTIILAGGSYLLLSILSRQLSVEEYSKFAAFWSIVTGIVIGVTAPLETFAISSTKILNGKAQVDVAFFIALKKVFVLGTIALIIVLPFFVPRVFASEWSYLLAIFASFYGFIAIYGTRGILVAESRSRLYASIMSIETLLRLVLTWTLIWLFSPIGEIASLSFALAAIISGFVSFKSVQQHITVTLAKLKKFPNSKSKANYPNKYEFSSILVASVSALMVLNLGPFVLQLISGTSVYAAGFLLNALTLARIPIFLGPIIQARLIPTTANLFDRNELKSISRLMLTSTTKILLIGSASTITFMYLGNQLVEVFFGSTYMFSHVDLLLIAMPTTLYLLAVLFQSALIAFHQSRIILKSWSTGVGAYFLILTTQLDPLIRVELASAMALTVVNIMLFMGVKKFITIN
jgi:O-antigen/teichoic acid export membrane protein